MYLEKIRDSEFWKKVRTDPVYRFMVEELLEDYETCCQGPIPDISYDAFMEYHSTGSRALFEWEYYFPRRKRLKTCALLSMIYPDNEEYFSNLCNTIWAICNEYCWCLPYHDATSETVYCDDFIDLFAAETGYALSEIKYMLGHRFSSILNQRISRALDHRIIQSFIRGAYGNQGAYTWERFRSNWAAVCAAGVAATFIYERPELLSLVQPRIDAAMGSFLESYQDDGVCQEGFAYWGYGFGFFACYAQLMLEYSGGKVNLFENEKVKKIALFPNCVFLSGNALVSFSDGGCMGEIYLGVAELLAHHYGDIFAALPESRTTSDHCARWCVHLAALVFYDPRRKMGQPQADCSLFYEKTGWFIRKNARYGFAIKAGHNAEPHNHNDVGSFILATHGEQVLVDLGAGEYTRAYFESDTRYTILCNRSLGHSVPFPDGMEQQEGFRYRGTMEYDGERVLLDLTHAYPANRVRSIKRAFSFTDAGFVLTDTYEYHEPCPVTERFVSLKEPALSGNTVTVGETVLTFDPGWQCTVSMDVHVRHDAAGTEPVWLIDFTPLEEGAGVFSLNVDTGPR